MELDERGVGEWIGCGCVLEDRTLYKGIRILPWAAAWVFRGGVLASTKFTHFSLWYRESLSAYVREVLLDARTLSRPYLERGKVEKVVREHLNGSANWTPAIHKLLTLEHIHRLFVDAQ